MFSYFTGVLVLGVVSNPFSLIAVLFFGGVFVVVRWLYVSAAKEFRRLEALGELKQVVFTTLFNPCTVVNTCGLQTPPLVTKYKFVFFEGCRLMYHTLCLLSSQSHLLSLVCYLARSACHSFILHAACFYGPVPWFPEQEHSGLVSVPGSNTVTN